VPEGFSTGPEFERLSGWGRRAGVEVEVGPAASQVPAGWEAARVALLPASAAFRRLVARFPVRLTEKEFVFDGRSYGQSDDAVALTDPAHPGETFVLGLGRRAVLRLLARRLFYREGEAAEDYRVVSGDLSKSGRFSRSAAALAIDRSSDKDEIASREDFFRSLKDVVRNGVRWQSRDSERSAIARWEPALSRFVKPGLRGRILVRLFPDPATKGRYTGSSRPADLSKAGNDILVDLDVSAPREPDAISPVLASAAFAARDPRLFARPLLLSALGARACGRWWGRDVATFAAFVRQAGVQPTEAEVVSSDPDLSPVLAVGAAASWLEAGAEAEGEPAVERALGEGDEPLATALKRWADAASNRKATAPARRPLPPGFLRGISYAMSNSVDSSYASPRSRETITRLAKMSADSISIMPFAFMRDARSPSIAFIHRR
jgi:hypothetical protein